MAKRNKNKRNFKLVDLLGVSSLVVLTAVIGWLVHDRDIALLNPKGPIADQQNWLLLFSTGLMLLFAGIVLFFIYYFAWKYRETNPSNKADQPAPDQKAGRSKWLLFTAWGSPVVIFIILTAFMLPATQRLEPQRSIESENEELTIRVIAMRWKWVFLYPEQSIATVNFVQIPVDTPVRFELTADEAPMQGFWIPHLGGMLYAMTEHVNPLNLMAHTVGDYDGGASEINGHGFASMRFTARVSSIEDFDNWVNQTAASSRILDSVEYARLLEPSESHPPTVYSSPDNVALFDVLLNKYYSGAHDHGGRYEPASEGAY